MSLTFGKIILFGDSITEFSSYRKNCYQSQLQELYSRKLDIVNRGFSGYNSDHARIILPRLLETELNKAKDNIKLLVISFGTNDASQIEDNIGKIQALSPEKYKQNLVEMVKLALENNIKPIIVGPALFDSRLGEISLKQSGRPTSKERTTNARNHLYSIAAKSVATQLQVPFVDMWNAFRLHGNWTQDQLYNSCINSPEDEYINLGELLYDGVHFTTLGYSILYQEVVSAIDTHYPQLKAGNLPIVLPYYRDIDTEHIEACLFPKT